LADAHDEIGLHYLRLGDAKTAHERLQQSLKIRNSLKAGYQRNRAEQRDRAMLYDALGRTASESGDAKSAKEHWETALKIYRHLAEAKEGRDKLSNQTELASALGQIGWRELYDGQYPAAQAHFAESLKLLQSLEAQGKITSRANRELLER